MSRPGGRLEADPSPTSRTASFTERGDVRIAPLRALPQVLRDLNANPEEVFAQAGVTPTLFDHPGNRISVDDLRELLSVSVRLAGCPHLGLLIGSRFGVRDLGRLGEAMRRQRTVAEALRLFMLQLHVHDRIAVPVLLEVGPSQVVLGYSPQYAAGPGSEPLLDTAIAIGFRLLRDLCGAAWIPTRVDLAHFRPPDIVPYRRLFGSHVRFNAGLSGISFSTRWLDHRIEGSDPVRAMQLTRELHGTGALGFAEEAQRVLHQLLLGGSPTAGAVARLFGMSERTLRKRLAAEDTSLRELLTRTRYELAQQLLKNTRLPLTAISNALCYETPTSFSRAFHEWSGMSPRRWRQKHSSPGN